MFIQTLRTDPLFYVSVLIIVVVSVVLHELGHGIAAIKQGDRTPIVTGHMTWNPMVHMGGFSLVLLLVAGIAFGSMPVSPSAFRSRYGNALVALAGPLVNLLLAAIALIVAAGADRLGFGGEGAGFNTRDFLLLFAYLNLSLCVFNLLPIPPLDGSAVLADFLPPWRRAVRNPDLEPWFMGAFALVFFLSPHLFAMTRDAVGHAYALLGGT